MSEFGSKKTNQKEYLKRMVRMERSARYEAAKMELRSAHDIPSILKPLMTMFKMR